MEPIRIAVVGDSISQGLGSKKINYIDSIKTNLKLNDIESIIYNFAVTGTTIDYAIEISDKIIEFNPDFLLVFYGNVEAIIRPKLQSNSFVTKILPKRYQKIFMLDPRPFFSKKKLKSFIQHLDTFYRFIMRKIVCKFNGTYRIMEPEEFGNKYNIFISNMKKNINNIICISNVMIDDKYFPGTNASLNEFRDKIRDVSEKNKTSYLPLNEWQKGFSWKKIYGNDHYHPNREGYDLMGELFANKIIDILNNN